jgi:hypothetical protein
LNGPSQVVLVVREVAADADRPIRIGEDGDEIRTLHLFFDELLRGLEGAEPVDRVQNGHVEIDREKSAILITRVTFSNRSNACRRRLQAGSQLLLLRQRDRAGNGCVVDLLKLKDADGLGNVVFGNGEVVGGKTGKGFAILIVNGDRLNDELSVHPKLERRGLILRERE